MASALAGNPVPQVVGPPIPQAVVPGSTAFTLTVYGANFVSGAVVNWNRSPRSTTFISSRELKAQILASDVAKPTAGYITVTNPKPGGGVSGSSYAIVEVHTPTNEMDVELTGFYTFKGDPFYSVTGDVTEDGILDLVTGVGSGQLALNVGNGDGTFQSAVTVGSDYYPSSAISYGSFTGNGKADLIYGWQNINGGGQCINNGFPCALDVVLNKGHENFRPLPVFDRQPNNYAFDMLAADFNGDGILDLAVRLARGGQIYLGKGDGTFKLVQTFSSLKYSGGMVAADFNGDGKLDLIVANGGDGVKNTLYLLIGNGNGTFQKPQRILSDRYEIGCSGQGNVQIDDFNGDGIPDLAFCDRHISQGLYTVRLGILLGRGDGTFRHVAYYKPGSLIGGYFSKGDFDSDGKTDLITSGLDKNNNPVVHILWGNSNGTFQKPKRISLSKDYDGGQPLPGDFNSDGLLDFVLLSAVGETAYIQK